MIKEGYIVINLQHSLTERIFVFVLMDMDERVIS